MRNERQQPFDSPRAARDAAELAGIDIKGMSVEEIGIAVLNAGREIAAHHERKLPKNYRRIQTPPYASPLSISIATIIADSLTNK